MLIPNRPDPNHPDDERLSALAAYDDDAAADVALASHVSTCTRCTDLVTELGALRASLAELPDLVPHRPLQLLPPVADRPATGAAGWIRRLFAPALTAGAAIAMVGLVGTAGPLFGGMASSAGVFENVGSNLDGAGGAAESLAQVLRTDDPDGFVTDGEAPAAAGSGDDGEDAESGGSRTNEEPESSPATATEPDLSQRLPAERSIWPMVLFTGVALMVAAALLRWILVPRAG
jgi:hypothetical protein